MNILNAALEHILFGKGKVVSQEVDQVSVRFSEQYGTKKFVYPDAFEKYLRLHDPEVAKAVVEELRAKHARLEAERLRKQQEYEAAVHDKTVEKLTAAGQKRKTASKSGNAKPKE